jgi:hypothetical protein
VVDVAEITDTELHEALQAAESALDDGDYAVSVHRSVAAYTRLIQLRPDMIVDRVVRGRIGGQSMAAPRPWPSDHGVHFSMDEAGKPTLSFAKERFTVSEAATYFEYTLDMALRAQRTPPP